MNSRQLFMTGFRCGLALVLGALAVSGLGARGAELNRGSDVWSLAQASASVHRFSTLFTAQDMRNRLSSETGLEAAVQWCKKTGVSHVYLESFRDGYQADAGALENAKKRFLGDGFVVSGCVTTTQVGKPSTGWKPTISCYTDLPTQDKLQAIFEFAAKHFDEVMIDDFWFTDCACAECEAGRRAKTVTIGAHKFPVTGDSWEDYRCELMVRLSQERILAPAKSVNPHARIIIKYPQWYDLFHDRGYDVIRETADFDKIWVGTETRDYTNTRWGGTVPYEGYFLMRWLGGIGGSKCGGGWYDWLGTTELTYVEQARQTVLAGARESLLFCYGGLQGDTGPKDVEALRANVPELLRIAKEVSLRKPIGIAAYKPANSHPERESRVFDFVGMLGLPLLPCHEFPESASAAFFSVHALKDKNFAGELSSFIAKGKPVLITDGLKQRLGNTVSLDRTNVTVLEVKGEPKSLLALGRAELAAIRAKMLAPLTTTFDAPNRVGLYLFEDGSWVVENFNLQPAQIQLNGQSIDIPARGWTYHWRPR